MPKELQRSRRDELNQKQFPSEVWFLRELQKYKIEGFRRNVCLGGRFFGDFVWRQKKIIVEIDGSSHNGKQEYDSMRDGYLESLGYQVLRIPFGSHERMNEVINILRNKVAVNVHRPQHVKNESPKLIRKAEKAIDLQRKRFQDHLALKKKLRVAYGYAKQIGNDKGNQYLENVLKKLNITPEQAKQFLS